MGNLVAYEFKVGNVKKKDLGIESRHVYMYLLIHPKWLEGSSGIDDGTELGVAMKDDLSGALTCNLGILRYDGKNLTAELDIRYPICGDQTAISGAITDGLR